jgi:uncharacterized Tic20 family protein
MDKEQYKNQDESTLAALAHGSILLGVFTSGVGGIFAALIIWLSQREKSAYVAFQSLQALVYQTVILMGTVVLFSCWGVLLTAMVVLPMAAEPERYVDTPPVTLWFGLLLLVIPCGWWLLTIIYGLWGTVRCLGGADFRYAIIGKWLEPRENLRAQNGV